MLMSKHGVHRVTGSQPCDLASEVKYEMPSIVIERERERESNSQAGITTAHSTRRQIEITGPTGPALRPPKIDSLRREE